MINTAVMRVIPTNETTDEMTEAHGSGETTCSVTDASSQTGFVV